MISKRIVFKRADGSVGVFCPSEYALANVVKPDGVYRTRPERLIYPGRNTPETEEELLERLKDRVVPEDVTESRIMDIADIPDDRYFRNAWKGVKKGKIDICRKKAEDIHMQHIRIKRNRALDKLDKEHMKYLGTPEEESIRKKKQVLRDIPQKLNLKSAKSLSALKKLWPKELDK